MLFEIKRKFSGEVLFKLECGSLKLCVEAAIKSGANLSGANLGGAYLSGADLSGADLGGAYLGGENGSEEEIRGRGVHDRQSPPTLSGGGPGWGPKPPGCPGGSGGHQPASISAASSPSISASL